MKGRINSFTPDNLELRDKLPTICVVGAGLSGLLTAIRIKESGLPIEVVVLDKPQTEANTWISGMRIRAKQAGSKVMLPEERSACDWVTSKLEGDNWVILEDRLRVTEDAQNTHYDPVVSQNVLREINTRHSLELEFGKGGSKTEHISSWTAELNQMSELEIFMSVFIRQLSN